MRMWMISPLFLCKKHLLGEHGEIHKHKYNFVKGHSISGRLKPIIQIEPNSMKSRHDEIAQEMIRRGYNHKSEYEQPNISYLPLNEQNAKVDINTSIKDLSNRCSECKDRILNVNNFI